LRFTLKPCHISISVPLGDRLRSQQNVDMCRDVSCQFKGCMLCGRVCCSICNCKTTNVLTIIANVWKQNSVDMRLVPNTALEGRQVVSGWNYIIYVYVRTCHQTIRIACKCHGVIWLTKCASSWLLTGYSTNHFSTGCLCLTVTLYSSEVAL
jgi:hypothetical protein